MSTGRTTQQADKDQRHRDEDNLELRNQRRRELGLAPLTRREYLAELGRAPRQQEGRGRSR